MTRGQVREICLSIFRDLPEVDRLIEVVDHAGVDARFLCFPPSYYLQQRTFEERNKDYQEQACQLGEQAVRACLDGTGIELSEIDHIIFITTTGLATPSIDALLAHRMGLRSTILRTPLFGIGCAGGVVGLARAAALADSKPGQRIIVLSVELCGQTLQLGDMSKSNLIGAALFGDGAAAALVTSDDVGGQGAKVLGSASYLLPESLKVMGWRFHGGGLELRLQNDVPELVMRELGGLVSGFLGQSGVALDDVEHFILHPGGAKVLSAYQVALGVTSGQVYRSREFLRHHGNLSSASILFVLKSVLDEDKPEAGDLGLALALGPGFAAEQLLVRW